MSPVLDDDSHPMEPATDSPPNSSPLPGARLSLVMLLAINLLNYIDRFVLAAIEPKMRAEFGITKGQSGYLPLAFILTYMVMAPVFGWLADRTSRWVLVGFSVIFWSAATAAGGLAGSFVALLITRVFVGVGEAGYGPAAPTIISDLYPVARRGAVLSWFYVAIPVGGALGYVIGGAVGAKWGWRVAFFAVTVPGLLLGIASFFLKDPPRGTADIGHAVARPKLSDYLHLLKIRSYVINTAAMAAMTFAIGGMSYWMPDYLEKHRGLSESAEFYFGACTAVAGLTGTLLGGLAGDFMRRRFSGSYFLVSGLGMLAAVPFILGMLYTPFPMAWGVLFFGLFFLFFNTGPANTALANVVSPSVRASAFAFNIFLIHALGDAPAPAILGHLADHYGPNAAFFLVAACMVLAGVLWLFGMPHLKPDTDAVTHLEDGPGFPVVMPDAGV
jgi:predicted MFS family arabinose efflux permease